MVKWLIFCIVMFAAHVVYAVLGFGNTLIVLPFLSFLFDIKIVLIPTTMMLSVITSGILLIKEKTGINYTKLSWILFPALFGLPFGFFVYSYFDSNVLKTILGFFILGNVIFNLISLKLKNSFLKDNRIYAVICSFAGGVVNSAIAIGGPLVTIAAKNTFKRISSFRTTLLLVWMAFDTIWLILYYSVLHQSLLLPFKYTLISLPCVLISILLSGRIIERINIKTFYILVDIVLVCVAIRLLI